MNSRLFTSMTSSGLPCHEGAGLQDIGLARISQGGGRSQLIGADEVHRVTDQAIILDCCDAHSISEMGLVSRVSPVHTAMRNCTRDEGGPFEVGNQVLISSHRKLLSSKATVVNVAEKSEQDFGRHG
jgi:hypothetical protein